jgi:hypothetical protein
MNKPTHASPGILKFLFFPLLGFVLLGLAVSILSTKIAVIRGGDRPTPQTSSLPEATQPNSAPPQSQEVATPDRKSRYLVARDAYRGKALETLSDEIQSNLVCSRKAYFRMQADTWAGQTGGSAEKWLRDNLSVTKSKVKANPKSFTGLSGEPTQFESAKAALDLLAALAALQDIQEGKPQRPCQSNFAIALDDLSQFQEADSTYESLKARYTESLQQQKEQPNDPS